MRSSIVGLVSKMQLRAHTEDSMQEPRFQLDAKSLFEYHARIQSCCKIDILSRSLPTYMPDGHALSLLFRPYLVFRLSLPFTFFHFSSLHAPLTILYSTIPLLLQGILTLQLAFPYLIHILIFCLPRLPPRLLYLNVSPCFTRNYVSILCNA